MKFTPKLKYIRHHDISELDKQHKFEKKYKFFTPFVFKKYQRTLCFMGVMHMMCKNESEFNHIKRVHKKLKPDLVIVEGISNRDDGSQTALYNKWKLEKKISEIGYNIIYCNEHNIPWRGVDPTYDSMIKHLTGIGYQLDDVFGIEIMFVIGYCLDKGIDEHEFKTFVVPQMSERIGIPPFDFYGWYKKRTKTEFTYIRHPELCPPNKNGSFIGRLSYHRLAFREKAIIRNLFRYINNNKYKKIFIVHGHAHLYANFCVLTRELGYPKNLM